MIVSSNPIFGQTRKSLVIGVDGMGFGSQGFAVASTPNMDSLIDGTWQAGYNGAYARNAFAGGVVGTATQQPTVSGPGWSTIVTGVWTDRHGVTGNGSTFSSGNFTDNPVYLGTLKAYDPNLSIVSYVNWSPIDTNLMDSVDNDTNPLNDFDFHSSYANDFQVAEAAMLALADATLNPDAVFVAFDEVDGAGHQYGSSGVGYRRQIETTDAYIGLILAALVQRPNFADESWQIIITADHGHRAEGGHGGQTPLEKTIPFIVASRELTQGTLPNGVSHADVAPTVVEHFGFPIPVWYWGNSRAGGGTPALECEIIDDFENLALKPFTVASRPGDPGADGTDYVPDEDLVGWVLTNDFRNGFDCAELAYRGWHVLDRDSWICEQQGQSRNLDGTLGISGDRNSVLVADPDAADDYNTGIGDSPGNYHSYIHRDFNLASAELASLQLRFDYELRCEDSQRNLVQISFDDGASYQTLLDIGPNCPNGMIHAGQLTFNAGTDFNPPVNASTLRLTFACVEAGNDWWFAIDNIELRDAGGALFVEDFEGYNMVPFSIADCQSANPAVGDGTDYAGDLAGEIPGWVIDNQNMLAACMEEAYNGWRAVDADQWLLEQGAQLGRSKFVLFEPHNTIMLADPDAFYDFPIPNPAPPNAFNSYASRTFDLTGINPSSVALSMEWEFASEGQQLGIVQVRFDDVPNAAWHTLLRLDSAQIGDGQLLSDQTVGIDCDGRSLTGLWNQENGNFTGCGTNMTLRVGCLMAGNNWWFAFDNVSVCGEALGFALGDANDDGVVNNLDIGGFVQALSDPVVYQAQHPGIDPNQRFDFNCDGLFNNLDIGLFINALQN